MAKRILLLAISLLFSVSVLAEERDAKAIVQDAINHWRGLSSDGVMTMIIHRPDWERTMVLVVADHGEGAGRHGESTHGMLAYDSTLAVPMFVRFPGGGRAGERSQEVTSLVDDAAAVVGKPGDD